jgi:hypothetical protein
MNLQTLILQTLITDYDLINKYGLTLDSIERCFESINQHKNYIINFGSEFKIDNNILLSHDNSKFSEIEFPYRIDWYYGNKKYPNEMEKAWLHHLHNNPHHWQHWVFPDEYFLKESNSVNGVTEMPTVYILEMVADWMAASKVYGNSDNMNDWLEDNLYKVRVHPNSRIILKDTLINLGYKVKKENSRLKLVERKNY